MPNNGSLFSVLLFNLYSHFLTFVISLGFEKDSDVILKILILYFYCQFLGIRDYSLLQPESSQFKVFKGICSFKSIFQNSLKCKKSILNMIFAASVLLTCKLCN